MNPGSEAWSHLSCVRRLHEESISAVRNVVSESMNRRKRQRLQPTLGDYLAIAIGPLLIGLLVGSMVFFLIEVFYQGQFAGRLQFIMAWFVVGAVGIARISIQDGREYAALFAAPLGILVAIAAWRFVEFRGPLVAISPLLSVGLVALIWWSTDCLTWDCTVLDEEDEDGEAGAGLLETAGLVTVDAASGASHEGEGVSGHESLKKTLWERFVEYRRRPHAPGVWVLYFSLAALPLFGLGQLTLAGRDEAHQRFVFLLLVVYVASGLGLLLITSFLNLRRYLRQRRLTMPATMAVTWVASGTTVIVAILFVCLVLAGSGVGYSVGDLPGVAAAREALATSRWASHGDGIEKEQGTQQVVRDDAQQQHQGDDGEGGGQQAGGEQPAAGPQREQTAEAAAASAGDQQQAEDDTGRRPRATQQSPTEQHAEEETRQAAAKPDGDAAGEQQPASDASGESATEAAPPPPTNVPELSLGTDWLKVVGWLFLAIVVCVAAWWYRQPLWAALTGLLERLRELWERLFGGRPRSRDEATTAKEAVVERRKTFAEYADPFASGAAEGVSTDDLIRYSFEAFVAWSGEFGLRRRPQQTAHEFVEVVGERRPAIAKEASQLAELVSWSAFASDPVPRSRLKHLERLWQRMRRERSSQSVMSDHEAATPGRPTAER
jgi:hypothetical protein